MGLRISDQVRTLALQQAQQNNQLQRLGAQAQVRRNQGQQAQRTASTEAPATRLEARESIPVSRPTGPLGTTAARAPQEGAELQAEPQRMATAEAAAAAAEAEEPATTVANVQAQRFGVYEQSIAGTVFQADVAIGQLVGLQNSVLTSAGLLPQDQPEMAVTANVLPVPQPQEFPESEDGRNFRPNPADLRALSEALSATRPGAAEEAFRPADVFGETGFALDVTG